jgi:hypothetical protein
MRPCSLEGIGSRTANGTASSTLRGRQVVDLRCGNQSSSRGQEVRHRPRSCLVMKVAPIPVDSNRNEQNNQSRLIHGSSDMACIDRAYLGRIPSGLPSSAISLAGRSVPPQDSRATPPLNDQFWTRGTRDAFRQGLPAFLAVVELCCMPRLGTEFNHQEVHWLPLQDAR